MAYWRFSAAPNGTLDDRAAPWAIFGESRSEPDGLEASAFAGPRLSQVSGTPGAPMFETESLFGAYMADLPLSLRPHEPVVVCVHSLFYEPRRPVLARVKSDNAHRTIFHFDETPDGPGSPEERRYGLTPWFARLLCPGGQGSVADATGLAIGFCYPSYGGELDRFGPGRLAPAFDRLAISAPRRHLPEAFERAYSDAEFAGYALAAVLKQIVARLDHAGLTKTPVDLLCHGLGGAVAMSALSLLARRHPGCDAINRIGHVVLLGGLCYRGQVASALANLLFSAPASLPAFYNITSGHDSMLTWVDRGRMPSSAASSAISDLSLESDVSALTQISGLVGTRGKPAHELYAFFGSDYPNWRDIDLQAKWLPVRLEENVAGHTFAGGLALRHTHTGFFTEPGNWALYRSILQRRSGWSLTELATRELEHLDQAGSPGKLVA